MQFNTNRASCNQESKIFTVYLWSKVIKILWNIEKIINSS